MMNENKNIKTEKEGLFSKYKGAGTTAFCVFAALMVLFFLIFKLGTVFSFLGNLLSILRPILVGVIIAYLLVPIVRFFEKYLVRFFVNTCKFKKVGSNIFQ